MEIRLSTKELSNILKVNRLTINRWERSGKLVPLKSFTEGGRQYNTYTEEHIAIIKSWNNKHSLLLELQGY